MPRLSPRAMRSGLALVIAIVLGAFTVARASALTPTAGGAAFVFSAPVQAFPCPLGCGNPFTGGTFDGTFSGVDVAGHPFSARWAGTANTSGSYNNGQKCDGGPDGELIGGGDAFLSVADGMLIDNGVSMSGATATVGFYWWQYGTALQLGVPGVAIYNSSGALVAQSLGAANYGAGQLIPVWGGTTVALDCTQQYPATLYISGSFGTPA